MYKFIHRVNELKKVSYQFKVIETVLDLIITMLSGFLIFTYMGISPGWAIIPPLIYLFIILKKNKFKNDIIFRIEERYPNMRERLRTIYDNKEQENIVIKDLASSILADMEKVKYSSFIDTRRLGLRAAIILLLVAFVLSGAVTNPAPYEPKNGLTTNPTLPSANDSLRKDSSQEAIIFNEPSLVKIGNDSQGLIVYRGSGSEPNMPGEVQNTPEYSSLFPQEELPGATSTEAYAETIPVAYHKIVRNYFTNLTRE